MGGDNDRTPSEPCAVDCKRPHEHSSPAPSEATDELGRPVPPVDQRSAAPDGKSTYLDEPPMIDESGDLGIRRRKSDDRP